MAFKLVGRSGPSCGTVGVGLLRPYCRCVAPTYIAHAMKGESTAVTTKVRIIVSERVEVDSGISLEMLKERLS